ncbi:pilus assembly protein TadG-related protein [Streptomyces sp. S1A]|uniref:pilus assembly protein TadG-related protein n=1 Tax=Streptomyces sp. ICN903 TaxID=2964654 RepID=UPI001EDA3F5B|nr:pilus assembly protein TadG-related protein [Streptomyces sp. ICN903]MCG3041524.1 pilus assembly protein TadG-related protein [Streptomyces sp. ICN903]
MRPQRRHEEGQAAPLYITAVVGLLFLALAFFAFGQADVNRNGAQTAADAAALAAAKDSRDQLRGGFLENILDGDYLDDLVNGNAPGTRSGCDAARRFAGLNEARTDAGGFSCRPLPGSRWGFTVEVESRESMGESIIPGTDGKHAKATATAVVEPRCRFEPGEDEDRGGDEPDEDEERKPSPGRIDCDGRDWVIDPENLDFLPDMADLFSVRLSES